MFFTVTKIIANALTTQHPQALDIFFLRRVCVNACKPFFLLREKVDVNELFISTLADYTNFCFTPSPQHRVAATDPLFPVDVKSLPSTDCRSINTHLWECGSWFKVVDVVNANQIR